MLLVCSLVLYGIRFPEFSDCPDDWAAFGSYVAGVSALIVGFATILLLLQNVRLLREQVDVSAAHADKQDQLIGEQRAALHAQERKERAAEAERAIERIINMIKDMDDEATDGWSSYRDAVARYPKRGAMYGGVPLIQHHNALRSTWPNRQLFPPLVKLGGLLSELQQRFSEAEREGIAGEYWAAWIAGSLPPTALQFLYYQTWLAPYEPISAWVKSHAVLRYVTVSILFRPDDARDDIPLPSPLQERKT